MKILAAALLSAVIASSITWCLLFIHFTGLFPWEDEKIENTVSATIQSEILHEPREVIITLPRNYSSQKQYPVLYVLDGSTDNSYATALDILAVNGYTPETIVVGIPNPSAEARQRDLTPPYMIQDIDDPASALGNGNTFLEFLKHELIPWVEKEYSTSGYRLLSGHSRGGLLVLHSLMANPDLFQARFCFSAPFWRQEEIILQKFEEFTVKTDSLQTLLFITAGDQETDNIKAGNANLAALLNKKTPIGMEWSFQLTPKADHQTNARQSMSSALGWWGKFFKLAP
jgi:predicted alpha/beta superfamily hydrolase